MPARSHTTGTNSKSPKPQKPKTQSVKARSPQSKPAKPAQATVSVSEPQFITLPRIGSNYGNLTFIEENRHIPFEIRRVYFLYDIPAGAQRGGHAHKTLQQLLIPLSGSFDVVLDDGYRRSVHRLDRPFRGLYLDPAQWHELLNFTSGAVCLVLASAVYDESDYIRDYTQFVRHARRAA